MNYILALTLLGTGGVLVWSAVNGENGFTELLKMLQGEPAFITKDSTKGEGGNFTGTDSDNNSVTDRAYDDPVERWRNLVASYFPSEYVDQAMQVLACESSGNPDAYNVVSGASGLFQHLPKYWAGRSKAAGWEGHDIFEPEANIAVASWLFRQTNTWQHWECKPSVSSGGGSGGAW